MSLKEDKLKARRDYIATHPNSQFMHVVAVMTDNGIKINDYTPCHPCLPFKGRHRISSLKPSL